MAGVWEFPGGKCEPGESPEDATVRECREEAGLVVAIERLRARFEHSYPHGSVELSYHDCRTVDPEAKPDTASGFVWVLAADLSHYTFPGANEAIIAALATDGRSRDVPGLRKGRA